MTGFPGWGEIGGGGGSGGGGGLPPSTPPSTDWTASRPDTICPPVDQDVLDFMAECFWWEQLAEQRGRVVLIDPEYTGRSTDVYEYFNLAWEKYKHDITPDNPLIFHFAPGIHLIRNSWRRQISNWRAGVFIGPHEGGVVVRGNGHDTWLIGYVGEEDGWDMGAGKCRGAIAAFCLTSASLFVRDVYIGFDRFYLGPPASQRYPAANHVDIIQRFAPDAMGAAPTLADYYDPTYEEDWDENYWGTNMSSAPFKARWVDDSGLPLRLFVYHSVIAQEYDLVQPYTQAPGLPPSIIVFSDCAIENGLQPTPDRPAYDYTRSNADGFGNQGPNHKLYIRNCEWTGPGLMNRYIYQGLSGYGGKELAASVCKMWFEGLRIVVDNLPGYEHDITFHIARNGGGSNEGYTQIVLKDINIRWRNNRYAAHLEHYGRGYEQGYAHQHLRAANAGGTFGNREFRTFGGGVCVIPGVYEGGEARLDVYIENVTIDGDASYFSDMIADFTWDLPEYRMFGLFVGWHEYVSAAYHEPPPASAPVNVYVRGLSMNVQPDVGPSDRRLHCEPVFVGSIPNTHVHFM